MFIVDGAEGSEGCSNAFDLPFSSMIDVRDACVVSRWGSPTTVSKFEFEG